MTTGRSSTMLGGGALNAPPTSIVNAFSANGATPITFGAVLQSELKVVLSGALTANVLATVLSLTGRGVVSWAAAAAVDATSRTHRLKITIDGTVVFDATTAAAAAANAGCLAIGSLVTNNIMVPDNVPFNTSFLMEYASSITETGKTNFSYKYRMG